MSVSAVGVATPVAPDAYFHTNQRSIASVDREDQYTLPGQNAYPTYTAIANGISIETSASHLLIIQADGTLYTRLLRVWITPTDDVPAAASVANIQIVRVTTAGSSGSAVTPAPYDTADTYAGVVQTLPSSKGTEGAVLWQRRLVIPATVAITVPDAPFYEAHPWGKPIVFGAGTGAGICFKMVAGIASATVDIVAEFIVTPQL